MEENVKPQVVIVEKKGNGMGTAGFVLALIGFILSLIPVVNFISWLPWLLGLIFSIIGIFKPKKGLAIAGLIISLLWVISFFVLAAMIFG